MDEFDKVRNRQRGNEARQRVMDRLSHPQQQTKPADEFDAVRNRSASLATAMTPVVDQLQHNADRADINLSPVESAHSRSAMQLQNNADRADVNLSPVTQPSIRDTSAYRRLLAKDDQQYNADKAVETGNVNPYEKNIKYQNDPPIIKGIHKSLDKLSNSKFTHVTGDFLEPLLTPGAQGNVIMGAEQGAANLIGKAVPWLGKTLGGKILKNVGSQVATGVPLGVGNTLTHNPDASPEELKQSAMYGAGGGAVTGTLGPILGKALNAFLNRGKSVTPEVEQQVHQLLALPEPKARGNVNAAQTPDVIYGSGKVYKPEPLALPQGNVVNPVRLKPASNNQVLNSVMERIKPIVTERMTPPLENPNELAKWVQSHFGADVSLNEVRKLPYEDLRQMAEMMRNRLNVADEAHKAASEMGYNLDELLNGKLPKLSERMVTNAQQRAYGVYPETLPNVKTPQFNKQVFNNAAAPVQRLGRAPKTTDEVVQAARQTVDESPVHTPLSRPHVDDVTVVSGASKAERPKLVKGTLRTGTPQLVNSSDELKFAQTVKNADTTDEALSRMLNEQPLNGGRTTNSLNQQAAQALIKRHGAEKLKDMLISKNGTLNATESTAAQILAKFYSGQGGDHNLSKAIDLVSKTARSGRELGQAVQALSQWNKLSAEGVMMLGERQANRRIANVEDRVKLTTEQAKPLQEVGQKLESVQQAKSLADDVVKMLANRTPNAPFTESEKSMIQRFNASINKVGNEVKPLLKQQKAAREQVLKEVGSINPKERTRDQVVNFLDAQAAKAREKLAKQRNVGIIADTENPVILHSIIGASHLAKGLVKFADWSEAMIKEGITSKLSEVYTKSVQRFRKENGLPTNAELNQVVNKAIKDNKIDEQTANSLRSMASEIGFYTDDVKKELTQDLQLTLQGLGSSTLGEKLAATQTGMMLLNFVTFSRNALGNFQQMTLEKLNKVAAVPIDWTFSKLTGERTIQFFPQNQEKFWHNAVVGTKGGWDGVSPTGTLSSYDVHPEIFKGKLNPLRYLVKATGASLQGMDHAAYNAAYGDVMATYAEQLGKAQNLTREQIKQQMPDLLKQLDDRVQQMADQAGLYATYQDETLLSRAAQSIKGALNKPTDAVFKGFREKGLIKEGLSMEGFGLGDMVLKFSRTPANIVMRGIDYSPLGFGRALYELAPLFVGKTSKFNQFAATRALSRAITGTIGLTGMGFVLAHNGILTGASSWDPDMRSIQEQSGQGAYKVNWTAMGRWFKSGFNQDAAKYQKGDTLMDYAWLQPAAISLAMGVNFAESWDRQLKPGEVRDASKAIMEGLAGGLRTVLENPMVQGLTNVVDATTSLIKTQDASKFGDLIKGMPASFIPSFLNQGRSATDNNQRETFDKNMPKTALNLIKNKIPGLSKQLPISYDSLGNPREKIQGGEANTIGQYLNSFLNPAKFTKYDVSPEAKMVLDVLNESGDTGILPRIASKSLPVDNKLQGIKNQSFKLNAQQFSDLQKRMGEMVKTELGKTDLTGLTEEQKAKRIKSILTRVGSQAKNELRVQLGYDKKK